MGFKIYTKAGDDGKTGLIGGERVSKHHLRVESYGTVDELNSNIGMVRCHLKGTPEEILLAEVQNDLFTIGSFLAAAAGSNIALPALGDKKIGTLESEIDRLTAILPELKNFILPGGSHQGAQAHVARSVCRRAERLVVHLRDVEDNVPSFIVIYLNRLSDYLFTLARFLDYQNGGKEIIWKP